MLRWEKRRTWKKVLVRSAESGFQIFLDEKPIETPNKNLIVVPTKKLADALAKEWKTQKKVVGFKKMVFNKLVNSSIDQVTVSRTSIIEILIEYGDTDLLCYRAEDPPDLCLLQETQWGPVLNWLEKTFSINLKVYSGVIYEPQDKQQLQQLKNILQVYSDFEIAALHELVTISGSLIIGLAVKNKALTLQEAWNRAILDESWQMQKWGKDQESLDRLNLRRKEFNAAYDFLKLLE